MTGFKPKACRILLTENKREAKLLSDRPRWGMACGDTGTKNECGES
jgi:hypothetical protein